MAETVQNRGKLLLVSGNITTRDLRMCYWTGTQTGTADPDLNTVADLEAVAGVSVAAERVALTSVTATEDDTNNRVNVDSANVAFTAAPGVTAQGVAIYDEGSGTDATRLLLGTYSTGFPQAVDTGLTITIADFLRGT